MFGKQKNPVYGILPTGGLDEPEKWGEVDGEKTYLDRCNCSNPNCHGRIARRVSDGQLEKKQSVEFARQDLERQRLHAQMVNDVEELIAGYKVIQLALRNDTDPLNSQEMLRSLFDIPKRIYELTVSIMKIRAMLNDSGRIQTTLEINETDQTVTEGYLFQGCSLITNIVEGMQNETLALPSGLEQDDPAKRIGSELPSNFEIDNQLLNSLFSKLNLDEPNEPNQYMGSDGAEE